MHQIVAVDTFHTWTAVLEMTCCCGGSM